MAINRTVIDDIKNKYTKSARIYNFLNGIFNFISRSNKRRQEAIELLDLKPGDVVIDMGCGTGVNFPFLENKIADSGKIIGVDLTKAMLGQANKRINKHGFNNIELVNMPAQHFMYPEKCDAILITFAVTIMPEYDQVIKNLAQMLRPGKKLAILELKRTARAPKSIIKAARFILKPLGFRYEQIYYKPWESMKKYFNRVEIKEYFFGALYIAVGSSPK